MPGIQHLPTVCVHHTFTLIIANYGCWAFIRIVFLFEQELTNKAKVHHQKGNKDQLSKIVYTDEDNNGKVRCEQRQITGKLILYYMYLGRSKFHRIKFEVYM